LRKPVNSGSGEAAYGKKQTARLTIERHHEMIESPAELPEIGGDASHIQILQEQVGYEGSLPSVCGSLKASDGRQGDPKNFSERNLFQSNQREFSI
jgi:hypothetical protein